MLTLSLPQKKKKRESLVPVSQVELEKPEHLKPRQNRIFLSI